MVRRFRSELVGHERVLPGQKPQIRLINEDMFISRHRAKRTVAIRHVNGVGCLKFKRHGPAVTRTLKGRHYCAPIGLPGGSAFGAGMAAAPVL